jgi:hypothetical protein
VPRPPYILCDASESSSLPRSSSVTSVFPKTLLPAAPTVP